MARTPRRHRSFAEFGGYRYRNRGMIEGAASGLVSRGGIFVDDRTLRGVLARRGRSV